MVKANDIRVGNIIEYKVGLWEVLKIMHTQPGKGGAFIQVEMKEIIKDTKLNHRFRSTENVGRAMLGEEVYQYLYSEGDSLILMHQNTYEQASIEKSLLGEKSVYLQDGILITLLSHNEKIVQAKVPKNIALSVKETEAVVKGQTASSSYKPAILENGVKIIVPPFIGVDDRVIVNTEENIYVEREK